VTRPTVHVEKYASGGSTGPDLRPPGTAG
jgi:hypothetical protein